MKFKEWHDRNLGRKINDIMAEVVTFEDHSAFEAWMKRERKGDVDLLVIHAHQLEARVRKLEQLVNQLSMDATPATDGRLLKEQE